MIDKPAGLVVHPAPGHWDDTLVNALVARGTTLSGGAEGRPGIVHRLDRDTSGLMVVAKTDLAHRRLGAAIAARRVRRSYAALAWGHLDASPTVIEAPIARHPRTASGWPSSRPGGRRGPTPTSSARFGVADLLRLELHTGRTHQIRVHLEHLGHPIVGDPVYGGGREPADLRGRAARRPKRWSGPRRGRRCMRQLWHSATPSTEHPSNSAPSGPPICGPHCLPWVAKTWLLAPTPLAIFFSSIEMANSPTLHAVIFRIGALICAAPAGIVREILPRLPATRIPGVAEAIEGLVNVRGTLLTVLDGHVLLQQARRSDGRGRDRGGRGRGPPVRAGRRPGGRFPRGSRARGRRAPDLPGIDPRLVKAVGVRDGQHFIVLDIDALLAPIIGPESTTA